MTSAGIGARLVGRGRELKLFAGLLEAIRNGHGSALVLVGEAGVGKTALLNEFVIVAAEPRTLRVSGFPTERELPFAALHQLCRPMLDQLDRLPGPQREALRTTFGMQAGIVPDPLVVGLAALTLLADVAAERPLLCVVDDAQWLDEASARTLAFVARRLTAEPVAMIFAVREEAQDTRRILRGLPELSIAGLEQADARQLLASAVRWPLDDGVRDAFLAEARGNPLALLELPIARSPVDLAGGFGLPSVEPLSSRAEGSLLRIIDELPEESRMLLLLAAADPVGDAVLLWRAARCLGLSRDVLDPVEAKGLLQIGVRVVFRHTLARSAVYRTASPADRRRAHWAIAEATDEAADPDRRVWHRAHATAGTDEPIAAELVTAAGRAQKRGGLAAVAVFLDRAAELTADPVRRADRLLAAARATYRAGSPDRACGLLAAAEADSPDALHTAKCGLLRAQMSFASIRSAEAPALLTEAARRLEDLDVGWARETYLEAFSAGVLAGPLAVGTGLADVAIAASEAPSPARAPSTVDLLLGGLSALYAKGFQSGAPLVRRALRGLDRDDTTNGEAVHLAYIVSQAAQTVWDDEVWNALTSRYLHHARAAGALAALPQLLQQRTALHLHQGELAQAAELLEEVEVIETATSVARPIAVTLAVAAWHGREAVVSELRQTVVRQATARGEGATLTLAHLCDAVLNNGLGRYPQAMAASEQATVSPVESAYVGWALAELVEAAVRGGDQHRAVEALNRLAARTSPSGTEWARGVEARARALVACGPDAEPLYREAIERLSRCRGAFSRARAHQVYGEWLRVRGRKDEARIQLETAYEMFRRFGAEAFAERARDELAKCGATIRAKVATTAELTAQQRQIARRARDGRSNAEIGAELFLSARTVEWHLRKVFAKLGIANRRELRGLLLDGDPVRRS
ncbi:ATP-binding protein [Micromonospora zamorensis]|uniref:ATP-binding protein n=1 Tax=Micromonospora zamorensis TaxID=709883 RepID=UPI003CF7A0B5